ncbi:hypothetical protein [Streptomyces violaceorubidus]|nr:hypothetical protein [Streptomyces violaceorubidus]
MPKRYPAKSRDSVARVARNHRPGLLEADRREVEQAVAKPAGTLRSKPG